MTNIAGSGSESGSISQRHGSEDPDPDPPQNVMDPQHWTAGNPEKRQLIRIPVADKAKPCWYGTGTFTLQYACNALEAGIADYRGCALILLKLMLI